MARLAEAAAISKEEGSQDQVIGNTQSPEKSNFVKQLAATDKRTRDKGIAILTKWLSTRKDVSEEDLKKIWKGLFYCMWHADKMAVQADLATSLAGIIQSLNMEMAVRFFGIFLVTMRREWAGIDRLRMDKFYVLVRKFIAATFIYLSKDNWQVTAVSKFMAVFRDGTLLAQDKYAALGINLHLADIYVDELRKMYPISRPGILPLLEPFCTTLAKTGERVLLTRVQDGVFGTLAEATRLALKLPASNGQSAASKSAAWPLPGSVSVAGGLAAEDVTTVSQCLFDLASAPETPAPNRKVLYAVHEDFSRLAKLYSSAGSRLGLQGMGGDGDQGEDGVKESKEVGGKGKDIGGKRGMKKGGQGSDRAGKLQDPPGTAGSAAEPRPSAGAELPAGEDHSGGTVLGEGTGGEGASGSKLLGISGVAALAGLAKSGASGASGGQERETGVESTEAGADGEAGRPRGEKGPGTKKKGKLRPSGPEDEDNGNSPVEAQGDMGAKGKGKGKNRKEEEGLGNGEAKGEDGAGAKPLKEKTKKKKKKTKGEGDAKRQKVSSEAEAVTTGAEEDGTESAEGSGEPAREAAGDAAAEGSTAVASGGEQPAEGGSIVTNLDGRFQAVKGASPPAAGTRQKRKAAAMAARIKKLQAAGDAEVEEMEAEAEAVAVVKGREAEEEGAGGEGAPAHPAENGGPMEGQDVGTAVGQEGSPLLRKATGVSASYLRSRRVRFSLKSNLVFAKNGPVPPPSVRTPPSAAPRGSALKQGVKPGPINAKRLKTVEEVVKARMGSKGSPAMIPLRNGNGAAARRRGGASSQGLMQLKSSRVKVLSRQSGRN